jgi:high-affinity iron transporter
LSPPSDGPLASGHGVRRGARLRLLPGVVSLWSDTAWDASAILSDTSLLGRALHTLVGYADQPSVLQAVVYAATLATIFTLSKAFAPRAIRTSTASPRMS